MLIFGFKNASFINASRFMHGEILVGVVIISFDIFALIGARLYLRYNIRVICRLIICVLVVIIEFYCFLALIRITRSNSH